MNARMQSVTSYAVSSCGEMLVDCGKLAPATELSGSLNMTELSVDYLPFIDGLMLDSANKNVSEAFAFTASTDPGEPCLFAETHSWPVWLVQYHSSLHEASSSSA